MLNALIGEQQRPQRVTSGLLQGLRSRLPVLTLAASWTVPQGVSLGSAPAPLPRYGSDRSARTAFGVLRVVGSDIAWTGICSQLTTLKAADVKEIEVPQLDPGRFGGVLEPEPARRFVHRLGQAADRLAGRRLWHVNSTEEGGGVAEMLHFLLGYLAGAGIDTRWVVLEGNEEFFQVTKRLHHLLHGRPGDGRGVDQTARGVYEQTQKETLAELQRRVGPDDVVVLHDPQTVGLAPELKRLGATVVWSCHVGIDQPNALARVAWAFLRPYVQAADAYVFSRPAYCWEWLDRERTAIIPPCIDAFAPKNQPMTPPTVSAILQAAGILEAREGDLPAPVFRHLDGSPGRVAGRAEMIQDGPIPPDAPIVLQVSRWDPLKDPLGVLQGFIRHVPDRLGAHLVLAGPAATSVSDDPESDQVLQQVRQAAAELPARARARLHLACLPMDDLEENGAMVNGRGNVESVSGPGQPGRRHPGPDHPRPERATTG